MRLSFAAVGVLLALSSCRDREERAEFMAAASASAGGPPLGPPQEPPAPQKGMAWIPPGALVAGTPVDALPRIADEEMPGHQVILKGFYIDEFAFPNEEGAIPLTNVTQPEAAGLCAEQSKRLCTELEWERACKGPDNHIYEYGDTYRSETCGTGSRPKLKPSGISVGCKSDFGVYDLHGSVWEWTSSPWGRETERDLYTLRGGNASAGPLVGRCANAMAQSPGSQSGTVGFRCCSGPQNTAEVTLTIERGKKLDAQEKVDRDLAKRMLELLPKEAKVDVPDESKFTVDRMWLWRPIGNEELVAMGGCAGLGTEPSCGVMIARVSLDRVNFLSWGSSGHWAPTLHADSEARDIWLVGGDKTGSFKRVVAYLWGSISVGEKERRVPRPPRKNAKKPKRR